MKNGKIVQCDVPMQIYDNPANTFVGGFIGTPPMNFFKGVVHSNGAGTSVSIGDAHILPAQALAPVLAAKASQPVLLGIRPENLAVVFKPQENTIQARVQVVEPLGSHKLLTMQVGSEIAKVSVPPDLQVSTADEVWLHFDAQKIRWMDAAGGDAIHAVN
jgi:multiple sugar transport system ATP-binding protein